MQGRGAASPEEKGVRTLLSPWGRQINAYVFVRSYQETEKKKHKSVAPQNSSLRRDVEIVIRPYREDFELKLRLVTGRDEERSGRSCC